MKPMKKRLRNGCLSITGVATKSTHVSKVMSCSIVNIDRRRFPKSSCTTGSSAKSLWFPISSVPATAKRNSTAVAMVSTQRRGRAEVVSPWMRIHISLNWGMSLTALATRTSLRNRSTVKMRRNSTSTPAGSRTHLRSTPGPKTRMVSPKLEGSKIHTQPQARTRRHHSTKKKVVKKCSKISKVSIFVPLGSDASMPMTRPFRRTTPATAASKCIEWTRVLISGYAFR
mmetsp:Transcript_29590/g.64333  ORF Transcript_29590/g.64333 Transcript_29590/m.64333 type:complete len:228 (-) Transcript_29590:360-1043(-)